MMTRRRKYIIIGIVLLVLIWLIRGWYLEQKNRASVFDQPEYTTITRGNLDVPISATGSVEPASRTEIKCKASGTVLHVFFEPGDLVKKGNLLVKLDPVDEQRTVDNARADVERAKANLALAESELEQAVRDWPTRVETALSNLSAIRAGLQGAMINFKKQDQIRQGDHTTRDARMDVFDVHKVQPVILDPTHTDPQIQRAGREVAVALLESDEAGKLVDYGKAIINKDSGASYWEKSVITFLEYQDALITMWQAQAKLWAAIADVRNAVNLRILIDQARTKVKLAQEANRIAEVQFRQAEQRFKDTEVFAPSDGLVQEVFVKKGQIISSGITTVTGGTPLMILADVSRLYVVSDVDEADIGRVRDLAPLERSSRLGFLLGNPTTTQAAGLTREHEEEMERLRASNNVDVTVDAFREESFTGRVDRVDPSPRNVNNIVTYNVRILLTSENRTQLMLGMHANVKFTSRKLTDVLMVANEAIKIKNEERGVYIDGSDKKPLFVPMKVGLSDGTTIELKTDKLTAGQKVYIKLPAMKDEEKEKDGD